MPRGRGMKQYFTFVKGWNTEATPTGFPENSATDLDNVILDVDGSVRRRPGLDYERNFAKFGLSATLAERKEMAVGFFEWLNVGGSGSLTFTVTQHASTLRFHRMNGDTTSDTFVGTIDMTPFIVDPQGAPKSLVQVVSGLGKLFVCGRYINPFYVEYDGTSLSATQVDIKVRDFEGDPANRTRANDEHPVTATEPHVYDLLNAGWPIDRINSYTEETNLSGEVPNVTTITLTAIDAWPSKADVHFIGMTTNGAGDLVFDKNELVEQTFGNTPAANGHFIVDAFAIDRNAATGLIGATNEVFSTRPETVAFHNGRVFWAGIFTQERTGNVYFSQQLTRPDKAGRCYQEQDPTSETFNDLLDTDGGLIPIPNAGQIYKMVEAQIGVLVFAGNGVWMIGGSDGKFSATNFAVTKITDIGCIGAETVVEADGTYLYWSDAGIIALAPDQISGQYNPTNLTRNTIQSGYLLIGGIQRRFARGAYITEEKKAVWLYNTDSAYDGVTDRWRSNGVLILDTQLGAWYKYSITDAVAGDAPFAVGIIKTLPFTSGDVSEDVTVGGVTVTVSAVDVTVSSTGFTGADISAWKILTVIDSDTADRYDLTMSEFYSRSWHDWFKTDGIGVNYTSFIETGYETMGNVTINKQPAYVFTYFSPVSKSISTGGYYELPPLVDFSSGFRVTQDVLETLTTIETAEMRTTQSVLETLNTVSTAEMRATQVVLEVLIT